MSVVLVLAGVYNLVWGGFVVAAPEWTLSVLGAEAGAFDGEGGRLLGPIWQVVGMIVGVYGVGYLAAARDPYRHWPIVLVGFLGKLFGPVGFVDAVFVREIFPVSFGWTILTNDLIWWVPFALMLRGAWVANRRWSGA
jgi:hypothetical protein